MANVVEIVVQGNDRSGPAINSAVKGVAKLGKGFTDLKGAIGMASNVMQQFGFSATGIAATMAVAGVQIATDFFEKIEAKAVAAAKGWDAFNKAVNTRRDLTQPSMVRERDINAEAQDEIAKVRASGLDKMAAREAENQIKITRDLKLQLLGEEQKLAAQKLVADHQDQRRQIDAQWQQEEDAAAEAVIKSQIDREEEEWALAGEIFESKKTYMEDLAEAQKKADEEAWETYEAIQEKRKERELSDAEAAKEAWAEQNTGLLDQMAVSKELFNASLLNMGQALRSFSASAAVSVSNGIGDAVANIATGALSAEEAFKAFGKQMLGMLVKSASQLVINAALAVALQSSFAATSAAIAAGTAVAWAPAAALVSLASYGANAIPAMAGIIATTTMAKGLAIVAPMAHSGLDYVPEEATYKLSRGEMVLDPGTSDMVRNNALGGGGSTHVTVQIDGDTLFRAMGRASRDGRLNISARGVV